MNLIDLLFIICQLVIFTFIVTNWNLINVLLYLYVHFVGVRCGFLMGREWVPRMGRGLNSFGWWMVVGRDLSHIT